MFRKNNEEINLEGLDDFIENPHQDYKKFSRVMMFTKEPTLEEMKPNALVMLQEDEQLTTYWIEDGKILNKTFSESAIQPIVSMLPEKDKDSNNPALIKAIISKYGCILKEEKEIEKGVNKVIIVLNKNPAALMDIIANHPFISATFLLDNLVEKMKRQNCIEKLAILFDKCLDTLVEACIHNLHDLERCVNAMPDYSDKVMINILSNEHQVKRIFESDKNPKGTLKEIEKIYPKYQNQFSEYYNKYFNTTPTIMRQVL